MLVVIKPTKNPQDKPIRVEASQPRLPLGGGGLGHPRRLQLYRAPRLRHQHECCQCPHSVPQGEVFIDIVCDLYSYFYCDPF